MSPGTNLQVLLNGTWLLKEGSSGTFEALSCEHTAVDAADSCVLVMCMCIV
jgi:hypothetical protein